MRKQWKIHRSWHIAAVMWSNLLLGHFFEPKARNNNHQFPIRLDLIHPEYSWIQKKYTDMILSKKKQEPTRTTLQQNYNTNTTNCVTSRLKIWSVGSLEPLNAELIKSLRVVRLHSDTAVLRNVAGLHSEVRPWYAKFLPVTLHCCCFARFRWHKESNFDLLSFRSETSAVIKRLGQHQVNVNVVLTFERGRKFDALSSGAHFSDVLMYAFRLLSSRI